MKIKSCFVLFTVLLNSFNEITSSDFNSEESTTRLNDAETEKNVSSVCGAVYVEKQFVLKSPNYPENYPPSVKCDYLLKGPHCPTYYEFEFLDFNLEDSLDCTKDRLEIVDQEALCGNYVGNKVKMYFSSNGSLHIKFVSDRNVSARGYNIQVTRIACNKVDSNFEIEETTTTEFQEETTTEENPEGTTVLIESRNFPNIIQEEKECCANNYSTKRFILTSPDFPYSLNKKTECVYKIRKADENICRLRLNFLFFWLGFTNYQNYCPYGSLEVDGKYICGCNRDIQLTTTFGNSDIKVLKFKTEGFYQNQNYYTGFVVEIIQDECPKKYSPQNLNPFTNNCSNEPGYYNDQISRVAWSNDLQRNFVEKLQLINERTELLDDDDKIYQQNKPQVIKSVYFFASPDYYDVPSLSKEKEKTTHLDTSDIDYVLTNINYQECLNWNQIQYNFLERNNYGRSLQACKMRDGSVSSTQSDKNCIELNYINGYFRSPGYPYYYPGNLNICYRFKKQPGYCKIKMFVHDFQIENSFGCNKDYILLANGYKYCGQSLFKVSWTMDLQSKDYEDMKFVTDAYYCGRGFSGVYQQIACQDMTFPISPIDPSTPPIIPTTSRPIYCDKLIKEESFTIEVNQDYRMCTFTIQKSSKNVCKINLYFEKFDLLCTSGVLLIEGATYCGNLAGRMVAVNTYGNPKSIIYRSITENKRDEIIVKIRGQQISNDCLFPEVPAERILDSNLGDPQISIAADQNLISDYFQNNPKYLVALLNKQFKDICGIVTNTTDKELPATFCQVLMNEHNVRKCVPLNESSSGVPYETKKPEVKVKNINIIKDVEFHEIDCDKL